METLNSLWGDDLEDEIPVTKKQKTKKTLDKIANPKKPKEVKQTAEKIIKSKTVSLEDKLGLIREEVLRVLGKQKDKVVVIKDKETYLSYINSAINNKRIDVDTETNNSLDPITCKLMGLCLYTPGQKQAYVPVNHRDHLTGERLDWQLSEADIREGLEILAKASFTEFTKGGWVPDYPEQTYNEWYEKHIEPLEDVVSDIDWIYHNGKFDYEVLKCTCNIKLPISDDTMIRAKLIDENEYSAGLKQQYIAKIDPDQEKYSIDHLFEGVQYADVDPEIFALYAATDSLMTDKLFDYQEPILDSKDLEGVKSLYENTEMPLVPVLGEMELNGMFVDQIYAANLSKKFHKKLERIDTSLSELLTSLDGLISEWKLTPDALNKQMKKQSEKQRANAVKSANYDDSLWKYENGIWYKLSKAKIEQLDETLTPDSLASPTQLSILLYDILKAPIVNEEKPSATGEEELTAISKIVSDDNIKLLCDLILERREVVKLLSTYIDNIPELAKRWPDGRVRTHFNQYGAQTGRLSSSDPINFQNIPSHEKSIRLLFRAAPGYRIIGADFSAQEPRLVAHYSQDENMLNAYLNKQDLYSVIASQSFNVPYEDCLEFYPEGTKIVFEGKEVVCGYKTHQNKAGKERRTQAKSILLGLLYGRGAASVGEQIGKTKEEAQEIIDKFFKAFPKVKQWIDASIENCRKTGYVEDVGGRRRRLPDIKLPQYTIRYKDKNLANGDFNPFIGCENRTSEDKLIKGYEEKLSKIKSRKQYEAIKNEALGNGIEIINNGGFISQAERQCVNARVQGGAATLTKCALIQIYKDQRLRDLGAKLINCVHDEILIEAPVENSELAAKYLCEDMVNSAKRYVPLVPMSCDAYNVDAWYQDEYAVVIQTDYKKLIEKGVAEADAENQIIEKYCELFPEQVKEAIHTGELHITY